MRPWMIAEVRGAGVKLLGSEGKLDEARTTSSEDLSNDCSKIATSSPVLSASSNGIPAAVDISTYYGVDVFSCMKAPLNSLDIPTCSMNFLPAVGTYLLVQALFLRLV